MFLRMMLLSLAALMLSACARPPAGCTEVSCRPASDLHSLTIWWQPQLRNSPNDYTQVAIDN